MGDLCRRVYSECGAGASERRLDKTAADPDGPSESDRQILGTDCGGWHTFVVKGVMARCSTLEESQMTTVCARRLSVGCTLCSLLRYSLQKFGARPLRLPERPNHGTRLQPNFTLVCHHPAAGQTVHQDRHPDVHSDFQHRLSETRCHIQFWLATLSIVMPRP